MSRQPPQRAWHTQLTNSIERVGSPALEAIAVTRCCVAAISLCRWCCVDQIIKSCRWAEFHTNQSDIYINLNAGAADHALPLLAPLRSLLAAHCSLF